MRQIFLFLNTGVSIYSLILLVRIILTWFRGNVRIPDFLSRITDPYLNLFRKIPFLRAGNMDLSPIAALGALSVAGGIFRMIARFGTIRLGVVAAMIVQVAGSALLFFIGFLAIVVLLRLVAYSTRQNTQGMFWRAVDTVSRPVLYRINRILFKNRIVNFRDSLVISALVFAALYVAARIGLSLLTGILTALPV